MRAHTMKTLLTALLCAVIATAPIADARGARGGGGGAVNPFNLPMLTPTQAANMFTFLGSFSLPSGGSTPVAFGSGTLSVSGNTMYVGSLAYRPAGTSTSTPNQYTAAIASFPIPTLSGAPDYTGGNGTVTGAEVTGPNGPGIVMPVNYTLTAAPTTGATSATLTTLPAGLTANAGWYVQFSDGESDFITGLSSDTISWGTALTGSSFTTTVSIWEWNPPTAVWASGIGSANNSITGIQEYNGELYVTGGSSFSGCSGDDLGWILTESPSLGPDWGTVNTSSNSITGTSTESSRYYASPIALLPSVWQPYFGTMYEAGAPSLSDISCYGKLGATFQEFNPANISATGGVVPITTALGYYYNTGPTSPESLGGRQYSGPFPTCTQTASCSPSPTGYPATLSTAPAAGDASVTLALPTASVTVTANLPSGTGTLDVTAVNSGTISNSGIAYDATDSAGVITGIGVVNPSYYYPPGTTLGVGSYTLFNVVASVVQSITITNGGSGYTSAPTVTIAAPGGSGTTATATATINGSGVVTGVTITSAGGGYSAAPAVTFSAPSSGTTATGTAVLGSATNDTVTLTPEGYGPADAGVSAWTITFSDGESRIAQIAATSVGATSTTATFSPALQCGTNGFAACTTAVTVAPMGDAWMNVYDGDAGGGFIVPGTRTFVDLWLHQYGIDTPRGGSCGGNSSSSMWTPLAPDTNYYSQINLYYYDLQTLYNQANGTNSVWTANPSFVQPFYDNANLDGPNGCPKLLSTAYQIGWSYFDYATDILYVNVQQSPTIIDEYKVAVP